MKYKKYIVFGYDVYYPCGGLRDIQDSFETLEEAEEYFKEMKEDHKLIVDRDTWEIIDSD